MISSCSVIIRKPLGKEEATLGIRAAWAMFTNAGIDANVILLGDGVYSVLGKAGYIKNLFTRFLGEGGKVYAVKEDLDHRGVDASLLPEGVIVTSASDVPGLIDEGASVMTF